MIDQVYICNQIGSIRWTDYLLLTEAAVYLPVSRVQGDCTRQLQPIEDEPWSFRARENFARLHVKWEPAGQTHATAVATATAAAAATLTPPCAGCSL